MTVIRVNNMTKLFTKEMLMYSLFDIRFKRPVRLMVFVYFTGLSLLWTLPILYIFWPPNVYIGIIAVGVPGALANLMVKPIWGGKRFPDWFKAQIWYITESKHFYDNKSTKDVGNYRINHQILVSRTKDYLRLLELNNQKKRKRSGISDSSKKI